MSTGKRPYRKKADILEDCRRALTEKHSEVQQEAPWKGLFAHQAPNSAIGDPSEEAPTSSMFPASEVIDLAEVWAGKARSSGAVETRGGRAIRFGLQHGHNFYRRPDRDRVEAELAEKKPRHLLLTPTCKYWGRWSTFNARKNPKFLKKLTKLREREVIVVNWLMRLYKQQVDRGGEAHIEQPEASILFKRPSAQVLRKPGKYHAFRSVLDQCTTGLRDPVSKAPIRKRTWIATSSQQLAHVLDRKCVCRVPHQHLQGTVRLASGNTVRRTEFAEDFTPELAELIAGVVMRPHVIAVGRCKWI